MSTQEINMKCLEMAKEILMAHPVVAPTEGMVLGLANRLKDFVKKA